MVESIKGFEDTYLFSDPVVNRNSYAQLCRYLSTGGRTKIFAPPFPAMGIATRASCKIYDTATRRPVRNKSIYYHELKFDLANLLSSRGGIFHFLFGDVHVEFLSLRNKRKNQKIIFTVHQPFSSWTRESIQTLKKLDGLITMCEPDRTQFAEALPNVPVKSIVHGVDIDYWKHRPFPSSPKKRVGYCGRYMRNTGMFIRIAERALQEREDVEFVCLITQGGMTKEWEEFGKKANVQLLQGLTQDEVLDFYQALYVLLMPLDDTTANNAVVEALSCGIPVLTTQVGGIGSYGGGVVYPTVENNDDDALYAELCRFLDDPDLCKKVGLDCRAYAQSNLAWPLISAQHVDFFTSIAGERALA